MSAREEYDRARARVDVFARTVADAVVLYDLPLAAEDREKYLRLWREERDAREDWYAGL